MLRCLNPRSTLRELIASFLNCMKLFRRTDKAKPSESAVRFHESAIATRFAICCSATVPSPFQRRSLYANFVGKQEMVQRNRARPWKEWQSGKLRLRCRTNGIKAMDVARALSQSLNLHYEQILSCTQRSSLALHDFMAIYLISEQKGSFFISWRTILDVIVFQYKFQHIILE